MRRTTFLEQGDRELAAAWEQLRVVDRLPPGDRAHPETMGGRRYEVIPASPGWAPATHHEELDNSEIPF